MLYKAVGQDADGKLWMTFSDKRVNRRRWLQTLFCLARIVLVLCNLAVLLLGVCLLVYAVIAFDAFEATAKKLPRHHPAPWFIYAFGAAGVFASFTALVGQGAACNCCGPRASALNFYVKCMFVLLAVQVVLVMAIFNDSKWRRRFPWDPSGEAAKMRRFIAKNHAFCEWGGVVALLVQIMSLMMVATINWVQRTLWDSSRDVQRLFYCEPHLVGRIRSVRELLLAPTIDIDTMQAHGGGPYGSPGRGGTPTNPVLGAVAPYQEPPRYKHPEPQPQLYSTFHPPGHPQPYYQPPGPTVHPVPYVVTGQPQPQPPHPYYSGAPSAPQLPQGGYYGGPQSKGYGGQ